MIPPAAGGGNPHRVLDVAYTDPTCRNQEEPWAANNRPDKTKSCLDIAHMDEGRGNKCRGSSDYNENCPGLCKKRCDCHDYEYPFKAKKGVEKWKTCPEFEEQKCKHDRVRKNCPTLCDPDRCPELSSPPSAMPSRSVDPSESPSDVPSENPSESPSDVPSENPSGSPSDVPSGPPSRFPSGFPSIDPSKSPSDVPSIAPSKSPSDGPSENPSGSPSDVPSEPPSRFPSGFPSIDPSKSPSDVPSIAPS